MINDIKIIIYVANKYVNRDTEALHSFYWCYCCNQFIVDVPNSTDMYMGPFSVYY